MVFPSISSSPIVSITFCVLVTLNSPITLGSFVSVLVSFDVVLLISKLTDDSIETGYVVSGDSAEKEKITPIDITMIIGIVIFNIFERGNKYHW